MRWLGFIILLGAMTACAIHPLTRHPEPACRELYAMFQDTAHWKYDAAENIYLPSEQLERLFNRNYDCFQGLSKKEVEKMAGETVNTFLNETYGWLLLRYDINMNCRKRKTVGCKTIIFYLNVTTQEVERTLVAESDEP